MKDIAATFVLMFFTVFIFTAFGMFEFGQQVVFEDEESLNVVLSQNSSSTGISGTASIGGGFELCPNLGICFLEFVNSGLRCVRVHVHGKKRASVGLSLATGEGRQQGIPEPDIENLESACNLTDLVI